MGDSFPSTPPTDPAPTVTPPAIPPMAPPEPVIQQIAVKAGLVIVTLATAAGLVNLVTRLPEPEPPAAAIQLAPPDIFRPPLETGPGSDSPAVLSGGLRLDAPAGAPTASSPGTAREGGGGGGGGASSGLTSRQTRFGDYGGVVIDRREPTP